MTVKQRGFENIVGKRENTLYQPVPKMFLFCKDRMILPTSILSSANTFNLGKAQNVSFAEESAYMITNPVIQPHE